MKRFPTHLAGLRLLGVHVVMLPIAARCTTLTQKYTYHACDMDGQLSARAMALPSVTKLLVNALAVSLDHTPRRNAMPLWAT